MKTLSVSAVRLDGELFAQLSAGNESGTKISLRIQIDRLFDDDGQTLVEQVFGAALACLLRGEDGYRRLERESEERTTRLVRELEEDDAALADWYNNALETF